MKSKPNLWVRGTLSCLAFALVASPALAESTYGYAASGTGTVTATARVNLSVTIPKLILLRVGTTNTTVDTLSWVYTASIPSVPTAPANGNNTAVDWNGTAPTLSGPASPPGALNVYAWTNATTATINCSVGTWTGPAGGPANGSFAVSATGSLAHPGANLGACASTTFASNTLLSGTWLYTLTGAAGAWPAGVYTNTVTYTAQGV